jgi:alkylation response protein AidB-like acyl-CoA dehydrogenase
VGGQNDVWDRLRKAWAAVDARVLHANRLGPEGQGFTAVVEALNRIVEGTNQIQRNIVADAVLGRGTPS